MDLESRNRWAEYSEAKDTMFSYTDTKQCPWWVVPSDDKKRARLNCISHLLSQIEYQEVSYPDITLPELNKDGTCERRSKSNLSSPIIMNDSTNLFYKADLNLLRTFRILLYERNMRKTAERLFVTQPAVSQALQKLRAIFDDELFVKVQGGLDPTPFALQLEDKIAPYLDGLETALNNLNEFEPSELSGTIKIALAPIVMASLAGGLFTEIRQQAPNVNLELLSWSQTTAEQIRSGEVFYGVHYDLENLSKELARDKIFDLEGRIIVRKEHPIKKSVITPLDSVGYELTSLISPGWNDHFSYASHILERQGYTPKVGFRSEMLLALIDVIESTDMLLPHSNLFPIHNYPNLRSLKVEVDNQTYTKSLFGYVHNKNRHSPKAKWIESIIKRKLPLYTDKHR
ncbi:transcriptional regulators LysR family [Vibrio variabilis]|uniref:Transcriptional regulators LysR family n=1 Tax=Vibrio variabilis TaxID=990271 RepID=A0ABQ0J4Z8_9VIBR|nr:transcriptional regulators LysR family [Vibrio variabilis]